MRVLYVVKTLTRKISLWEECELARLRSEGRIEKIEFIGKL